MSLRETIVKFVCADKIKEIDKLKKSVTEWSKLTERAVNDGLELKKQKDLAETRLKGANETISVLTAEVKELSIQAIGLTPVDLWCMKNSIKPVSKYYKDKIKVGDILLPCDLRELITPNSYLVKKARDLIKKDSDLLSWYKKVAALVHGKIKYRIEAQDNYFYPNYTLTMKEGDCEDFTFLQCSIEPELANAYGFMDVNGKVLGHSFGVGIINDGIHIFDAVTNKSGTLANMPYTINYIVTKNQVWQIDGSTEFGDVLW